MFVKVTPRKKNNKTYHYAELVKSYRENGKVKHKRILYFGGVDPDTASRLKAVFSSDFDSFTNIDKVDFRSAVSYGNYYFIYALCSRLKMFDFFNKRFVSSDKHISAAAAVEYIKAMIFQRIIAPDSKLALSDNLSLTPLKHLLDLERRFDLQSLYRSLEVLEENFHLVEKYLYHLSVENFNQNDKELFYDITSSYFEGCKCIIAQYGYSRDKRKDKEQIVIGIVTTSDGFPVKCNIYPGNRPDKTTVAEVIGELKREYSIDEIVFVGDRGMLSEKNIKAIEELNQKYVMAIPRAWSKKYIKSVIIDERRMQRIKKDLYAISIPSSENQRFLLCLNTQKREDDRAYRESSIKSIKEELDKLNAQMNRNANIKTKDEAMRKAGAISKSNYTGKYFRIETVDSIDDPLSFELKYELKTKRIKEDERVDGTFLIRTNKEQYSNEKLLEIYKNLSKVENAFKIIKNDLDIRPMYHRKESRIKGHVYICVIAYFIIAAIEYISKKTNLNKSARKILRQLSKVNLLEISLPNGKKKYTLTTIEKEQKRILNLYGIKKLNVPIVV